MQGNLHQRLHAGRSLSRYRALQRIEHSPTGSLSDIATQLGMTLPAASQLIDRLFVEALVMRVPAPVDRRRMKLTLTSRGQSILDNATAAAQTHLGQRLAGMNSSDLQACQAALVQIQTFLMTSANPPNSANNMLHLQIEQPPLVLTLPKEYIPVP